MLRLRRQAGVSLVLLGAAAAFGPPALAADAPVPVPDATSIVDATLAATNSAAAPDAGEVLEVVEEIAEAAVPAVLTEAAAPAVTAPAQPSAAPAEAAPAQPAAAPQTPAPAPETPAPAPEAPAPAPEAPAETLAAPVDSAATVAAAAAAATVQQVRPINVNISIRVESPGDNGAVTQVNAALGAVVAEVVTPAAGPSAAAQPQLASPKPPVQAEEASASPAAPAPSAHDSPPAVVAAPTEQWDWTWSWDCGEVISPDIVLPGISSLPIWNWNWDWNCGEETDVLGKSGSESAPQYQSDTSQYQPINLNISIRIASPGSDGPVSQGNIAQTVASIIAAATAPVLSPGAGPGWDFPSAPATPPALEAAAAGAVPAQSLAEAIVAFAADVAEAPLAVVVELTCCLATSSTGDIAGESSVAAAGGAFSPTADDRRFGPDSALSRADITATEVAAVLASDSAVAPQAMAALVVPRPKAEAARRAETHERLTRHVKHSAAPARERAAVLSYGGVTPLGAPDHSSKILLLFLFPFVFALAAAARRVEDEDRAAAAEPGRPEGRPG